jgi:hypothetical protein
MTLDQALPWLALGLAIGLFADSVDRWWRGRKP